MEQPITDDDIFLIYTRWQQRNLLQSLGYIKQGGCRIFNRTYTFPAIGAVYINRRYY